MNKRHWKDILKELQEETLRDGYFCRADGLRKIVNELIEELEYVGLLEETDVQNRH